MTIKSALSATGKAALTVASALNNAPIRTRMYEIDTEIAKLQKERAELEAKLV